MVIFYIIGSLEKERERERERESFAPIETFFCQSNLFVFVDNTWVVSLSDSWTTIFGYEGFKFQPMWGGSLILLRTSGSWFFFKL